MSNEYAKTIKQIKKTFKNSLWNQKLPISTLRSNYEKALTVKMVPNNIDLNEVVLGKIAGDLFEPEYAMGKRIILYVHGGGFVAGSRLSHRNLCASLAHETGSRLLLPEFRLAPEHPFPTGLQDLYHSYEWLLKEGYPSSDIIVAGDGSGANLAIALVHTLMQRNLPKPTACLALSPWVDLTCSNIGKTVKKKVDPLFTKEMLQSLALQYTFASNLQNMQASPFLEKFNVFPPTYIQCGSEEILLDEALALVAKMQEAGVQVELDIENGMWHLFQAMESYSPVAHLALARIGKWVHKI